MSTLRAGNQKLARRRTRRALPRVLWLALAIGLVATGVLGQAPSPEGGEHVDGTPYFVALSVADAGRSMDWYQRVLGFETVRSVDLEERGIRIRLLQRDGAFLELIESQDSKELTSIDATLNRRFLVQGVFKIGFHVDDLEVAQQRLATLGVDLRGRVIEEEDLGLRSLQIEDPDGNVIQLFAPLDPAD